MLVSESNIEYQLEDVYILKIGTFYLFKDFLISEFNEGVTVDWESVQEILQIAESYYGIDSNIAYISNRVHNYSLVPQDWLKFFKARKFIDIMAVVSYTSRERSNILLEKMFFKNRIRKFYNLNEAVAWAVTNQRKNKDKSIA